MQPQGSTPVNLAVFEGFQKRIEGCASCEQLQEVTAELFASVTATMDGMLAQLEALQPLANLTIPGANPAQIVTWITDFTNALIKPMIAPTLVIPIQIATITAQMAQVTAAVQEKMAQFESCTVPVPPLPSLPTP